MKWIVIALRKKLPCEAPNEMGSRCFKKSMPLMKSVLIALRNRSVKSWMKWLEEIALH
jgi:hypothetical protein